MAAVTQEFKAVGDEAIARAYEKLAQRCAALEAQNAKLGGTSERSSQRASQGLDRLTTSVRTTAAQYAGLQQVLSGLWNSFDQVEQRGREALNAQTSWAAAQARLIHNSVGKPEDVKANVDFAQQIVKSGFPSLPMAQDAVSNAVSAAAGNDALARQAVFEAHKYTKHTPQLLDPYSGAAVDIAMKTGVNAEEALALAFSSQSIGRVADPGLNAKNLAKALGRAGGAQRGDRRVAGEAAGEIFSWLTTETGDTEGSSSATAMANLAAHLDEMFTKGIQKRLPWGGTHRIRPNIPDPGNARDRMIALFNDPAAGRAFAEHFKMEAGFEEVVDRAILDPNSSQRANFKAMVEAVGYDVPALRARQAQLDSLTPQLSMSNKEAASAANKALDQAFNFRDSTGASANEAVRTLYRDTMEHSTFPAPLRGLYESLVLKPQQFGDWMTGYDQNQRAVELLERRRDEITVRNRSILGGRSYFDRPRSYDELNPREQQQYTRINEEIELRREMLNEQKQTNQLLRKRQPSAGPAMNAQRGAQSER